MAEPAAELADSEAGMSLDLSSPSVRVRVSFGGTSPRLRAIAFDILGAVVPWPPPAFSKSPKSAEGAPEGVPERALAAPVDGRLPAHTHEGKLKSCLECMMQGKVLHPHMNGMCFRGCAGRSVGSGLVSVLVSESVCGRGWVGG